MTWYPAATSVGTTLRHAYPGLRRTVNQQHRLRRPQRAVIVCVSSLRLFTPSPGQLPDATADRRPTMSRPYNDPTRFAEEAAEGFVSTVFDKAIAIQLSTLAS